MKTIYQSWCKYCGVSLEKRPVKTGNCCTQCRIQKVRLYTLNHTKKGIILSQNQLTKTN